MGGPLIAYLDTHVAVWLAEGKIVNLSKTALDAVNHFDLLISPMVLLELDLIFEKKRIVRPSSAILHQLRTQLDLRVCDFPLHKIVETASTESWTRDPMDRMIVAHARANAYASLISKDEAVLANYSKAIW